MPLTFMRCATLIFALAAIVADAQEPLPDSRVESDAIASPRAETPWPLLRQSEDNTRRSRLLHSLAAEVDSAVVIERLHTEGDVSARRALILTLGGFGPGELPAASRAALLPTLLDWYRNDPDPGVHSAIDWLLRHGRRGDAARALDWQQADALDRIDVELRATPAGARAWYVTAEGQTLAVIGGPVRFEMGAPANEAGRQPASDSADEPLRLMRIPRSFAIALKEVTVEEFGRFLAANPRAASRFSYADDPARMRQVLATFSPDADGPQVAVTWYEAAMYCNWLSLRDGLPESEWVYPPDVDDVRDAMRLPQDYLHRTGYRLPTEAEWEYAARAGSTTSRFFGSDTDLLDDYAWYSKNPPLTKSDPVDPRDPQRTWPVGQLKPNDFGLFDVYGNVWEWMQDRMQESFPTEMEDAEDAVLVVTDADPRTRRGGAFAYGAAFQRSAHRGPRTALPTNRRDNVGFRIARTRPTAEGRAVPGL